MLRVGIIGCGKIADQHVSAIERIPGSEIVAVCDREPLMAQQIAERFEIKHCFSDASQMLAECPLDVVHITTPPQGHAPLARQCIDAGVNVYLEKPFTVTADEAKALIGLAESRAVKITAGHNLQFTLEMLQMRRFVESGYLGGRPVHLESHFSYDLGSPSYVGPLLHNPNHWVRQLPGQLFHNIISHGIARLAEFLDDEIVELAASAHQSPSLIKLGGGIVRDELRVLIRDKNGTTAFFCFSTQIKPGLNQFRICGPKNSLWIDQSSGTLIRQSPGVTKSYLTYFFPPLRNACEHLRNARRNLADFVSRRLYQDAGMKELIARFYQSIQSGGAPPIPYREILRTARIMDEIFAQIGVSQDGKQAERQLVSA
jgi:predicted dehydrogenase